MASTPPTEEAFLREVDEELRREQLQSMWKRYGRLALVGVVLALAAFAAFLYWRHHSQQQAEKQGEALATAIVDIQQRRVTDAGRKLDQLIAEGGPGYRVTALFGKAAIAADKGEDKAASDIYAGIAADEKVAQPYRDVALIRQTLLEYDRLTPQQVIDRMKPLAAEDSAWFGTAGELTAIALIQTNRPAEAGRLLAAVARDKRAPVTVRARAERLASSLGVDVSPDTANTADKD